MFVANNPNPFIISPLILTALLSFGIFNVRVAVILFYINEKKIYFIYFF